MFRVHGLTEFIQIHIFFRSATYERLRAALQWWYESAKTVSARPVREIQQWMGSFGGNVANAYVVKADALRELGAQRGIIENVERSTRCLLRL